MRKWQKRFVDWSRFGRIPDDHDTFDDWRRRIHQEDRTLARISRLRLKAWLQRKKAAA